jgi:thiamine-monophosphate kinase
MGAPKSGATPRDRPGTAGGDGNGASNGASQGASNGASQGASNGVGTTPAPVAPVKGALGSGRAGAPRGERAAVERLRRRLPGPPPGEVWIGDDAAVLARPEGRLIVTTDLTVAGVHGDLRHIGLEDFGWRALVRAVSDVAAMGGRPVGAVVAVAAPPDTDLDALYDGIAAAAVAHGCPVVGGDLSTATQLVVAVTVDGDLGDGPAVLRSGARPGDALVVSGPLGGAAAGLRALSTGGRHGVREDGIVHAHLRPRARLAEGEAARRAGASAMIDVSDGLLLDLARLADASGVGFALEAVPVHEGASLEDALGGGDDYELVMAHPDGAALAAAFAELGLRPPFVMGTCVAEPGRRTLGGAPVRPRGFEHPLT